MLEKYVGNRKFYKNILVLMIPIFIQNGITNFVNMLDNIMVGRVGQFEMTGVSVTNQIMFVFYLLIFGALSGAGIFGAQFVGSGDVKGIRDTFRFKMISCLLLTVLAMVLFKFCGEALVGSFLKDGEGRAEALKSGKEYLDILLIGLIPYTIAQSYASTLRETGHAVLPMVAGVAAVVVNLSLNWVLIFGKLGAPMLGVAGAAIATVISRFAELAIVVIATHKKSGIHTFIVGAYKNIFEIPKNLVRGIVVKGLPLMLNETMWSFGMTMLSWCYSQKGLDVVSANAINTTFVNVFSVAFISLGSAIGIYVGQLLGAEEFEEAYDGARKLTVFSVAIGITVGLLFAACTTFIPNFYDVSDEVKHLAVKLMLVSAAVMPLDAYVNGAYFALRSGGQILITIIFDSGFVWAVYVPTALILARTPSVPIVPMYAIVNGLYLFKDFVGYAFFIRKKWLKNIVL